MSYVLILMKRLVDDTFSRIGFSKPVILLSFLACAGLAFAGCAAGSDESDIDEQVQSGDPLGGEPTASCADKSRETGLSTLGFFSDGRFRRANVYVPDSHDPSQPTMLVLNFHAFGVTRSSQELLSRMYPVADERGFIVVNPQGEYNSWNAGDCCGTAWVDLVDDVQFVRDTLDEVAEKYCIDEDRIFATGMSNGGFFSHRVACELSDRIAAVAPVAGVLGLSPDACLPGRAIPIIDFHGTADPIVPYGGGSPIIPQLGVGLQFRSVDDTMEFWAANNGCEERTEVIYDQGNVECVEWSGCLDNADTVLCTAYGSTHTWPGGLPIIGTSRDIDATRTIIDFFEAHPMK